MGSPREQPTGWFRSPSTELRAVLYQAIVRRIARKNIQRVNDKDFEAVLAGCALNVHHRFGGDHALGVSGAALRLWFGRLGRLGRHLTLTVEDIWMKGLPHDTTIIIRWSALDQIADGLPYKNRGVHLHVLKMRWGEIVDIDAHDDSQTVANNLARQAALGVAEATAPKVMS